MRQPGQRRTEDASHHPKGTEKGRVRELERGVRGRLQFTEGQARRDKKGNGEVGERNGFGGHYRR